MLESGFFCQYASGTISFSHPIFTGYLATLVLADSSTILEKELHSGWIVNDIAAHYLAAHGQSLELIENSLYSPDPPLFSEFFRICRWMKDVPFDMPWKTQVMRQLIQSIHRDDLPLGVRARFFTALVLAGDPSVPVLMRQLLHSISPHVRRLAALGCGALQDEKSMDALTSLLADPSPDVRLASAFAIGIIHSVIAVTVCQEMIDSGDEDVSQIAAECLSTTEIGHRILQTATQSDQILTRRAAVIGLAHTHQDWAYDLLEKIAVQDGQWVVRNVAGQMLENFKKHGHYIPIPNLAAHETPWLISFAARLGEGVEVGGSSVDLLIKALQTGSLEEKMASLKLLCAVKNEKSVSAIMDAARSDQNELNQAALNTLYLTRMSGIQIPG